MYVYILYIYIHAALLLQELWSPFISKVHQIANQANKLNQNLLESQTIFIGDFSDSHGSAKDKSEQNALGKLRKRYDMI